MFEFLIFVVLLIVAPAILFVTGIGIMLVAIPFIVFFGVWAAVIWLILLTLPAFFWLGIAVGLLIAIGAARAIGIALTRRRDGFSTEATKPTE